MVNRNTLVTKLEIRSMHVGKSNWWLFPSGCKTHTLFQLGKCGNIYFMQKVLVDATSALRASLYLDSTLLNTGIQWSHKDQNSILVVDSQLQILANYGGTGCLLHVLVENICPTLLQNHPGTLQGLLWPLWSSRAGGGNHLGRCHTILLDYKSLSEVPTCWDNPKTVKHGEPIIEPIIELSHPEVPCGRMNTRSYESCKIKILTWPRTVEMNLQRHSLYSLHI
jgi:hypothetical protein